MPTKSMMSLSRSVMNLIVEKRLPGAKSLRCVDLSNQLFNNTPPPSEDQELTTHTSASDAGNRKDKQAEAAALKMERIQLSSPIFTFQASASALNEPCQVDCFPLADGKVLWADQLGRSFLLHVGNSRLEFMPHLHKPKNMPFSLFVPSADAEHNCGHDCRLFVMERFPRPESIRNTERSYQFEAFVYYEPTVFSSKAWLCQPLPPPPFFHQPAYWHICPGISSYAVIGSGKHICISVDGFGSYCLDIENYTWSDLGKWTLPFHGKVEYVPELKLWFGLSAKDHQLVAADLSAMDSQPQLMRTSKQLMRTSKQLDMLEEWKEYKDSQLVYLGSGRFCIAKFFHKTFNGESGDYSGQFCAVFTGVEVLPPICGSKEVELQMIPHKSICHMSIDTSIDAVF